MENILNLKNVEIKNEIIDLGYIQDKKEKIEKYLKTIK